MKKHTKLFFIFSVIAQIFSYIGAAFMLFRKNKPAAGLLAAIGLLGTIFGLAALDYNSEGNKKSRRNVKLPDSSKKPAPDISEFTIDTAAEEKELFDSIEFDASELDTSSLEDKIDIRGQDNEIQRIGDAIDILKGTAYPEDERDADIEAELNRQ